MYGYSGEYCAPIVPCCEIFQSERSKASGSGLGFHPVDIFIAFSRFFPRADGAHTASASGDDTRAAVHVCAEFSVCFFFSSLFMGDLCILSSIELQCKMSKIKRPFLAVQCDGLEVAREVEAN